MCGIAGICNDKQNSIKDIQAMNAAMLRRGPDDGNYWYDEQSDVMLGHRRLSIVDLSANGRQPMQSVSERYMIVYNGEIYNYKKIQNQLLQEGFNLNLRGSSDTEILLAAIENWGIEKTLTNCKGMFAFAVYDRKEKELILARDRMGEKPLYYGMVNGKFVFCSDFSSFKALKDFHNDIDTRVITPYLLHGYITAPYSIYKDIYKLEPGSFLKIKAPFQKWEIMQYWDMKQVALHGQKNLFKGSFSEASLELEKLLKEAITGQMIADVPLGAFLSGGIDSTLVVSLMQSLNANKIKTYTIGFHEDGYNEAEFAGQTAKHLGTDHTEMYVGFSDVFEVLQQIPEAFSEPFADSSQIPTMLVSKMTRQHVTVALSGDGGDEFFCGYNTYREAENGLNIMKHKLNFLKNPLRSQVGKLCMGVGSSHSALLNKIGKCLTIQTPEDLYRAISNDDYRIKYLSKDKCTIPTKISDYQDGMLEGTESNLMLMDMLQYLPDDILTKVDRSGMFYSLESRIPLLDADVMKFSWQLPHSYKFHDGVTKAILKDILYRYVPEETMNRPKKGFSIPVGQWLQDGQMHDWAIDIMNRSKNIAGEFIDTSLYQTIWNEFMKTGQFNSVIWNVLVLEQWLLKNN